MPEAPLLIKDIRVSRLSYNRANLPEVTTAGLQCRVIECSAHHGGHARRSVEQIEEGFLRDMVQVHVAYVCAFD